MRAVARAVLLAALVFCAWSVVAVDDACAAGDQTGTLRRASWRLGAWGRSLEGHACWLRDRDGTWRLEIRTTRPGESVPVALEDLLHQRGEGWTVLAAGDHGVFMQPWRDKFEEVAPAHRRRLTALIALAGSGREAVADVAACGARMRLRPPRHRMPRTPWSETPPAAAAVYLVDWPGGGDRDFRRGLEVRGYGRGAAAETWQVQFADEGVWRATSSRRAGALRVEALPDSPVVYDPDEVFVPLWPLGDVLSP
ncbi:hypothetical protein H8E07_19235 [bacterium]|nr:hypothetical protein [bacterium]